MDRTRLILVGTCLILLAISTQGYAQLYKWVAEDGTVHYGDSPPEQANLKQINGELSSFTGVSVESLVQSANAIAPGKVVMFSTEWCGFCRQARRHFRNNNIAFTEYDVEKSEKAARAFKELNGRAVPVILIGSQRVNGFSQKVFDRIYQAEF